MSVFPAAIYVRPRIEAAYEEVDQVCSEIVEALLQRGLATDGHTATAQHYGDTDLDFVYIKEISGRTEAGEHYSLRFGRQQGRIGGNGDVGIAMAGIRRIRVPGYDLELFDRGEPWIRYPEVGHVDREAVFTDIAHWLRQELLVEILSYPRVPGDSRQLLGLDPTPWPDRLGPLRLWCSDYTVSAIQDAVSRRRPILNRALMVTLSADLGKATSDTKVTDLIIPTRVPHSLDTYVLQFAPLWANGIYVVDYARYRQTLGLCGSQPTLDDMTDALAALAASQTLIHEYRENFLSPVVLIRRHLATDEVSIASGPWPAPAKLPGVRLKEVIRIMRTAVAAELREALAVRRAYRLAPDPTDRAWSAVEESTYRLAYALGSSTELVPHFVAYQRIKVGELPSVAAFVGECLHTISSRMVEIPLSS